MKPPKDEQPSALFQKLLEPEPSDEIDFPRYNAAGEAVGKLRVRVLQQKDHDTARLQAEKSMLARVSREDLSNPATKEVLGDAIARELLAMACLTAEPQLDDENGNPVYGRVFRNASDLSSLRPNEISVLFSAYLLVQSKYGPFESNLDDGDIAAWVQRLKEGASQHPLLRLPLPALLELTMSLAQKLYGVYEHLGSQHSSLPDTLVAHLDDSLLGIFLSGEHAAKSATDSGDASVDITTGQAARLAQELNTQ